jgi:hypothetical protein
MPVVDAVAVVDLGDGPGVGIVSDQHCETVVPPPSG